MSASPNSFTAYDPATGEPVWSGAAATQRDVDAAIAAARTAFEPWGDLSVPERANYLEKFGQQIQSRRADLIEAICRSLGKPRWESATEVDVMFGKVSLTIQAYNERRAPVEQQTTDMTSATRYKPHGVLAVFGPFNFPGHLPNGHILPALLAGNCVIFKPSEQTPLVGQIYSEIWSACALPLGVFAVVQGARETGALLANHRDIDGLLFTGSFEAGVSLNRAVVDDPGKIVALEMGGNNPLIVANVTNLDAAAYWTIQSAFLTAGQRCSCARRLIVVDDAAVRHPERYSAKDFWIEASVPSDPRSFASTLRMTRGGFIERLVAITQSIRVGKYTDSPEPFMGPVISSAAAQRVLDAQGELLQRGAKPLLPMKRLDDRAMLSPGILDVTSIDRTDVEIFGPLLQVIRVRDFDEAIREANNTRYGLAAALFSDDRGLYEEFFRRIRAGVVNWNRPTTGASGALPFGGIGRSGNHRPSGYFAVDYCAYPIASMESAKLEMPKTLTPGIS
jgi:succinylglutamic semialdehyde dehydrogenase